MHAFSYWGLLAISFLFKKFHRKSVILILSACFLSINIFFKLEYHKIPLVKVQRVRLAENLTCLFSCFQTKKSQLKYDRYIAVQFAKLLRDRSKVSLRDYPSLSINSS